MRPFSVKSEMDIFQTLPTQISIKSSRYVNIPPISPIVDGGSITFLCPRSNLYTDLSRSFLLLKCRIVNENGTVVPEKNGDDKIKVGPVNLLVHSLFKQMDLSLNGVTVSHSSPTYHYR